MRRVEATDIVGVNGILNELAVLAHLGVQFSTAIAGCSLAIAPACATLDRKRTFGVLRLMGMPVVTLRRVLAYEGAVSLIGVQGIARALEFIVAWIAIPGPSSLPLRWPDTRCVVALAAALHVDVDVFGQERDSTNYAGFTMIS